MPFNGEFAALLFEQPRGVHQVALVDLVLVLRGVEQRDGRQHERALPALGRRLALRGLERQHGAADGECCDGSRARRPARARRDFLLVLIIVVRVGRQSRRTGRLQFRGGLGGLGRDFRRLLAAGLLDVFLDDLLALAVALAALRATRDTGRAALPATRAARRCRVNAAPKEKCVARIMANASSVSSTIAAPVRFSIEVVMARDRLADDAARH